MKHGFGRKLLSIVLAVMMMVSLLPTAAFAEELTNSAEDIVVYNGGETQTGNDSEPVTEDPVDVVDTYEGESEGEEAVTPAATAVAKIGETKYDTLEAAIEAAADGATIVLLANVEVTDLTLNKGVTITSDGTTQYEIKGLKAISGTGVTLKNVYLNLTQTLEIGGTNTTLTNCYIRAKDLGYWDIAAGEYTSAFGYDKDYVGGKYSFMTRVTGTNVTMTDCVIDGTSNDKRDAYFPNMLLAPVSGTNVTMTRCTFNEATGACYYSMPKGTWTLDGCKFTKIYCYNIQAGDTAADIVVKNCELAGWTSFGDAMKSVSFENCSFAKSSGYATVVAYKDATFTNCTFTEDYKDSLYVEANTTVELNGCKGVDADGNASTTVSLADIAEPDTDKQNVVYDTAVVAIDATKDASGKYTGGTFVGTETAVKATLADGIEVVKNDDGSYGVTKDADSNIGTKDNPYTLKQLGTMTREEYIAAQERLSGTMYVTVGDYSYEKNGVLGNGVRNDATGQVPDHSKLNAYGENGYLGEKNDGANGKNIVFVGGSITSGATGYTSIDNIGTSLLLAVPAYTNVTFQGITFNNVMSFDYQLYTSPWSQLGELKFEGCKFNGIIVGAIAAQTLTFNGCEFTDYTNTVSANNSNPTWIRPAYGNWSKGDNEGQGDNFKSLTTINFTGNKVTSTRPVKFERIAQWEMATTVTATGNTFDISAQEGDTSTKNVGMYFGANAKFDLVLDNTNTKSANTKALYTAVYSAPDDNSYAGLPAGSTVKDTKGNEFVTDDALEWKTDTKLTLKSVPAETPVASIGDKNYASLADAIANAKAGDTVILLADATEDVTINKNITLDLNGKTLTNTNAGTATLTIAKGATATVKNGTVKGGDSYYDIQNNGTATLEDVTATGNNAASLIDNFGTLTITSGSYTGGLDTIKNEPNAKLTITDGEFTLTKGTKKGFTGVVFNYGELTITGGTFTQSDKSAPYGQAQVIHTDKSGSAIPSTKIEGGTFKNLCTNSTAWTVRVTNAAAGSTAVSGGTFNKKVTESYLAEGFELVKNSDGTYGVDTVKVAQIGETKYETLAEAIAAAKDGDTVKLLKDCSGNGIQIKTANFADKGLIVDFGGFTYTVGGVLVGSSGTGTNAFQLLQGGKVTFQNGTIAGVTEGTKPAEDTPNWHGAPAVMIQNYCDLTLDSMTVTGGDETVYTMSNNHGNVVINNSIINAGGAKGYTSPAMAFDVCLFDSYDGVSVTLKGNSQINGNIELSRYDDNKNAMKLTLEGGTIDGELKIADSVKNSDAPTTVTKNDKVKLAAPTGYVWNADGKLVEAVAKIGDRSYESLQAAIDAAGSGATVTMLADTRESVTISKKLTLDLNGHTLNGGTEKGKPALTVTANVTVKDSSEAQTGTIMREDTAENSGVSSHYVIDIQGDGWLIFEGGNVKNDSGTENRSKGASLVRVGDDSVAKYPGLNIKGGTFTQDNFIVIKVDRGDLFLNGGTLNSANTYAIENWHRTTIKGGTVNGTVAAWTYSGGASSTLTIKGGTINGNVKSVNYGNSTDRVATVSISGGTVKGELGTYTYNNGLAATEDTSLATIAVSGGTFDRAVDEKYCAEGFVPVDNGNDTYGVEQQVLAKIDNVEYYTMDAAFRAVQAGETIVMQRDYVTSKVQNSGYDSFTIDLNGHTWTYTGTDTDCAAFEINYSDVTLTVKNGKVVSNSMVGLIPSAMNGTITYNNSGLVFEGVTMTANGHRGIETNGGNTNDTVTLKNSTLNVLNGYGIYFPSSGTLTIDNSTINAKTMGVQVCAGSLNINDGSKITVTGDAVEKTENDGAIEDGAAISIVNRTGYKGLDKIEVTGGTFTAKAGNAAIKAYNWANNAESDFTANDKVAVSGGTFSSAVPADLCATGYIPVANDGGTYTVEKVMVAQIGEVKYGTLAEAVEAAKNGDTITLLADIDLDEQIATAKAITIDGQSKYIIKATTKLVGTTGKAGMFYRTTSAQGTLTFLNVTLDGNGVSKIFLNEGGAGETVFDGVTSINGGGNSYGRGIHISGGGSHATIRNSTLTGSQGTDSLDDYYYAANDLWVGGNVYVTVENSTIGTVFVNAAPTASETNNVVHGQLTIKGEDTKIDYLSGEEEDADKLDKFGNNGSLVKIENGSVDTIFDKGSYAISGGTFKTAVKEEWCAAGFIPTTNEDGTYGVKKGTYVAKVDGVKYDSLQAAIDAAKDGSTVRLLENVVLAETAVFPAGKTVHINLQGHNITAEGTALLIKGKTDIQSTGGVGTIESTKHVAVAVGDNANLTVYSGTLKGREGAVITSTATGAKIEIRKNATLIATDNAVIAGNGTNREGEPNTILVKGGTFIGSIESKGYIACGIYAPWKDNVTVSGGTFNITNGAGIVARAGTVKVTGGTFNCTGDGTGWVGDNKNQIPCAALVFDADANYPAKTDDSQILVSGGTFSTDPAANGATLATGYVATLTDGMYSVAKANPVAKIGDVKYDTLQAAIYAAQEMKDGATITLLTDINTTSYYEVKGENPVTIDLAGHNITGSGAMGVFHVKAQGDLTITGEGTITAVENNKYAMAVHVDSPKAKVTLAGGTYTQQITNEDDPQFDLIFVTYGTVEITGGTYEAATPAWTLNCKDENYKSGEAKITVTGGTFKDFDPANNTAEGENTNFLPDGYVSTKNEDDTYTVEKVMVAQIGNNKYGTLAEAVTAAKDGDTITLLTDVEQNTQLVLNKSITLDLAGKKIYNTKDIWEESTALISIENKANVTITGNGTIEAKENDCYTFDIESGSLTIENGEYIGNVSVVQVQKGTLTVNGGTFSLLQKWNGKSTYLINCIDSDYKNGDAKVFVKGGTFTDFDPANNTAEGTGTNFVAAGYMSKTEDNGATYTVVVKDGVVAVIGETEYSDLSDALKIAAENGGTVLLVADVDNEELVNVKADVTLDLNGHSITKAELLRVSGQIKDTATEKGVVSADGYVITKGNLYTPVYDSVKKGYSFFNLSVGIVVKDLTDDGTKRKVAFYLDGANNEVESAAALMLGDSTSRRVKAYITFTWKIDEERIGEQKFTFSDTALASYLVKPVTKWLYVNISGANSLDSVSVKGTFEITDEAGDHLYTLSSDPMPFN